MIHLPEPLALPIFRRVYPAVRRRQGSPNAPICRKVTRIDPNVSYGFNRIFNASLLAQVSRPINYDLPAPKLEFLNYLCDWRGLVAHGSNLPDLSKLAPIRSSSDTTDFGNREQVFATPDAVWALWLAILDRKKIKSTRNGCIGIGGESRREKYYHFELPSKLEGSFPFSSGTVYFARAESFPSRHAIRALNFFGADYEEWGSDTPVIPLAKIDVEPNDFPYLNQVQYCL